MLRLPQTSTSPAILAASLLLVNLPWTIPGLARAASADVVSEARALLENARAGRAVALLEEALTDAPPSPPQAGVLALLRQAYAAAAREAERRGRNTEAELYRDNLDILNRRRPSAPLPNDAPAAPVTLASGSTTLSGSRVAVPATVPLPQSPAPLPAVPNVAQPPEPSPATAPLLDLPPATVNPPPPSPSVPPPASALAPAPAPAPVPAPVAPGIDEADAAFRAGRYDEAGRIYTALYQEGRLPAARRDHWAYCRWDAVVRRINARPARPQEWAEIDAEIERIRALSPHNWYGEYLRNRAAERSAGGRAPKARGLVFRGSAPEEPPLEYVRPPGTPVPVPAPVRPAASPVERAREARRTSAPAPAPDGPIPWQVHETESFRIHHVDPALAEQAAVVAETARTLQIHRWTGATPKIPWSPKCDLYLYPTARHFSQMTGQPEESPGFSTMGMNGGRIIARRVNLRADHPNLIKAIMPHEITHVVLADLFPHQQIPRWADEGMAVLSEPPNEQHLRAADLNEPLRAGQLFKLEHLMAMDYPEGKYWGLYYAQSVSLTRFLVEEGTPTQFVQFVQRAQQNGVENELRRIYKIDGYADLHNRWLKYARGRSSELTAAKPEEAPGSTTR